MTKKEDWVKAFDSVSHTYFSANVWETDYQPFSSDSLNLVSRRLLKSKDRANSVLLQSGVAQGSILGPTSWNYYIGDMPTTTTAFSDNAVYAKDIATVTTHRNRHRCFQLTQEEIWALKKRMLLHHTKPTLLQCAGKINTPLTLNQTTYSLTKTKPFP